MAKSNPPVTAGTAPASGTLAPRGFVKASEVKICRVCLWYSFGLQGLGTCEVDKRFVEYNAECRFPDQFTP